MFNYFNYKPFTPLQLGRISAFLYENKAMLTLIFGLTFMAIVGALSSHVTDLMMNEGWL